MLRPQEERRGGEERERHRRTHMQNRHVGHPLVPYEES